MIKELIVNVFIVLLPILAYQLVFMEIRPLEKRSHQQIVIGLFAGITGILCMNFPLHLSESLIQVDMRWIPFTIGFLYGGILGGGISASLITIYRLSLLAGFYSSLGFLIASLLIAALCILLENKYTQSGRFQKIEIGVGLISSANFLSLCLWYFFSERTFFGWGFYAVLFSFSWLSIVLTINVIEIIRENFSLKMQMQRSERFALISEMAASIAHEVRNPLTVVRGFLQLGKSSADQKLRRYMEIAIAELDRAASVLSDYLDFAKPQLNNVVKISVSEKMTSVLKIVSSYASMNRVEIISEIGENLYVSGDKSKLKQALLNILKNAIEAMPDGGTLHVETCSSGGKVSVFVSDSGEGMTSEQLQKLGNPFYTTKSQGTGLGLMVTFRLLEAMNATLKYESEPGKGTKVCIVFPEAE
ncbi:MULTISPECIES: ATP-binding protein [unclassified Paenibacillus]|uniref:ATP-binding protein n=1 Tax=unclassified Paenibacillus TaxID=185978 RepID=UPI00278A6C87|nr:MULTISPECIES: ATP-binding protein [unclassified Paenibacillus]MDQ0901017.1 two-component system sporulation sensor kinase B [Paenibacillus sp. V4I7]MDQ0920482.1 two-component system sporulation sensor kinase B [Paenibacillus sp. V4I5]